MKILLTAPMRRRMAWTDQRQGYLCFESDAASSPSGGYWRGGKRLFVDLCLAQGDGDPDLFRVNARYTDVMPEGCVSAFDVGGSTVTLGCSLLSLDAALALTLSATPILPSSLGIGLLLADQAESLWIRYSIGGATCWQNDHGVALAASEPFRLVAAPSGIVSLYPERCPPSSPQRQEPFTAYAIFESDGERARAEALQLVASSALAAHTERIASFFARSSIETGDSRLDDAIQWARFSAWMLS